MLDNSPTKQCPYCGEDILAVAIKCKHCMSDLSPSPKTDALKSGNADKVSESTDGCFKSGCYIVLRMIGLMIGLLILWFGIRLTISGLME